MGWFYSQKNKSLDHGKYSLIRGEGSVEHSREYPPAYEVHHTLDDEAVVVDLTAQVLVVFTTSDGAGCCPQRSALF